LLLKDAVGSVMESGRKSDAQTVAMANGKANVMDVVTAVADTDVAVSTLVSVRDRVIAAYEDIMKMPI
jgi:flagellar hook-basal body complex protein FliE